MNTSRVRLRPSALVALALVPMVVAATPLGEMPSVSRATASAAMRWKINTHLYAANLALADAVPDGAVNIPPFGEIPIAAAAWQAIKTNPAAYRAGVLAPDLFPDMYVGGWFVHSDLTLDEGWIADNWLRHVWASARSWSDPSEKDKVMAFAYGFVTHGAGDIFAHTWVNQKANGAWVSFQGKDRETAFKHIVLEGYVGEHTPPSDLSLDVWPRFVSNVMIKDPLVRKHTKNVPHYQRWLAIRDALDPLIARAKSQMNATVGEDAPYWLKCTTNPIPCARKEQMETWHLDINRGLRAIVDSSETLGEQIMAGEGGEGIGAMTGWAKEWLPKMYGAHAIGEGTKAMSEFMDWANNLVPIDSIVQAEVERFFEQSLPKFWALYEAAKNPSTYLRAPLFSDTMRHAVDVDMGIGPGGQWLNWHEFEPLYNTVILSKLALLDGNGLNELARRAGVSGPIVPNGDNTNIMLGVFRSMTQSFQWVGDTVNADTLKPKPRFGICGHENMQLLPDVALCGVPYRPFASRTVLAVGTPPTQGFVLWGHPEAREKIFKIVFKGFGAGPGRSDLRAIVTLPAANVAGVKEGRRALRSATSQTEYMREVVEDMKDKVGGGRASAGAARAPGAAARPGSAVQTGAQLPVANWGQRCCAKDVAELRAALAQLQSSGVQSQSPVTLARLGRRPSTAQINQRIGLINGALDAFANARDAAVATAALNYIATHVQALASIAAGNQ